MRHEDKGTYLSTFWFDPPENDDKVTTISLATLYHMLASKIPAENDPSLTALPSYIWPASGWQRVSTTASQPINGIAISVDRKDSISQQKYIKILHNGSDGTASVSYFLVSRAVSGLTITLTRLF